MQQRSAIIARLAALEGSAFLGLAICTIGATNGILREYPYYWINVLPGAVLIIYGAATFPTKENLVNWFERAFVQQ
jgi:Na+-transporting NADH:ubiquinone oxidoreductase subunit NqrB